MITTVFECISVSIDEENSEMSSIGLIAEYTKGNSSFREQVNLVMATTDNETAQKFEEGKKYISTFIEQKNS